MWIFDKFKKSLKRGLKTWTRCNWPELSSYCGCCQLSTGIYLRCMLTVVVTTATIIFNTILLISLVEARKRIRNADVATLEDLLEEATDSDQADLNGVFMILDGVVAFYILWSNFKFFYIIRNIWTIYAVYKKKRRTLKVLLYIGVPCWIFDGCLSIVATIILRYLIKGLLFINFMFDGYNLLAVHSKYKEISGKSRIVKDIDLPPERIMHHIINNRIDSFEPHCITCTCYGRNDENNCRCSNNDDNVEATPDATPTVAVTTTPNFATVWSIPAAEASTSNEDKAEDTLNFKDTPIIFNQEILQSAQSEGVTRSVENTRPQRPTTLAVRPIEVKEEKTDLCDTPVIYDEGQFNIGTSPIIEGT